jgi:hypothetical protein
MATYSITSSAQGDRSGGLFGRGLTAAIIRPQLEM